MSKYFISEISENEPHAGSKARQDISVILKGEGWTPIMVRPQWKRGGVSLKVKAIPEILATWMRISKTLTTGDILLLQYPLAIYPKVSQVLLPILRGMKRRGIRLIALIHDLDSLRGYTDSIENKYLSLIDVLIAHNSNMADFLEAKNFNSKVVSLEIFDYLTENRTPLRNLGQGIDVAGNLSPEKAGYVYLFASRFATSNFNLFGPNFEQGRPEEKWYRGSFSPDELPEHLGGTFGLIWDGPSVDTCEGSYGEYLRFNNPHKLSLYLACNEPVLIWNQAAEAQFVVENGVGFAVASVQEGVAKVSALSSQDYEVLRRNASYVSERLRKGTFTREAVKAALELL